MAVAYVNGYGKHQRSTSCSWSLTTSGTDRFVIAIAYCSGGKTITGATFNTVALGFVDNDLYSGGFVGSIYKSTTEPAATTANVVATYSAYSDGGLHACAFSGVDQNNPITVWKNSGTSTAPTVAPTLPSNGAVWGYSHSAYTTSGTITATAGTLLYGIRAGGMTGHQIGSSYRTDAGTMSWSIPSSAAWYTTGIAINPVAVSGSLPPPRSILQAVNNASTY